MDSKFTTNKIIFDYFAFTVKEVEPEDMITLLGLDGVNFIDLGSTRGYHHRYYYDGVSIMFGGREYNDVFVEMSGQGCRVYESYGNDDWFGLSYYVLVTESAKMCRIDVAYDDFNGLLDLDLIQKDVSSAAWVARCDNISVVNEYSRTDLVGSTVMCGKRGSNISCRIYDKAKERNRQDEIEHWVRCELQIRHKHADNFLYYLLADDVKSIYGMDIDVNRRLDSLYFAVLNHFLRFIDLNSNSDSNLWRKPLAEHWKKFIESYKGKSISLYSAPGVEYNVSKLVYTTTEQFGGMIYTYIQIFGLDELGEKVKPKKFKLNKKYEVLIESERLRRKELANAN